MTGREAEHQDMVEDTGTGMTSPTGSLTCYGGFRHIFDLNCDRVRRDETTEQFGNSVTELEMKRTR